MIEYDDASTISAVEAYMKANPSASRRKAIIAVAGKSQLRRIEVKMAALAKEESLAIPETIGGATHFLKGDAVIEDGTVVARRARSIVLRVNGVEKALETDDVGAIALPGDKVRVMHADSLGIRGVAIVQNLNTAAITAVGRWVSLGLVGRLLYYPGLLLFLVGPISHLATGSIISWPWIVTVIGALMLGAGANMGYFRKKAFVAGLLELYGEYFLDENGVERRPGRGVDDAKTIEEIRGIMAAEPELSRRAAILRVVDEDSLRRIEMKMKRMDEAKAPMLHGAIGFLKWHKLADKPLVRETVKVIRIDRYADIGLGEREGIWVEKDAERKFLEFDYHGGPVIMPGMTAEVLYHGDKAVALKTTDRLYYNKRLIAMHAYWGMVIGFVVVAMVFLLTLKRQGIDLHAISPVASAAVMLSLLGSLAALIWLMRTKDGRMSTRPYDKIAALFP